MNKDTFFRKSATAGGYARTHSLKDVLAIHSHQPLPERVSKSVYAKLCSVVIPDRLKIGGSDYDFINAGGQQLVYGSETQIVKLIPGTLSFQKERAEEQAEGFGADYRKAVQHMGEHITSTDFDLRRLRGGLFSAIAIQPRIKAMREFKDVAEMVYHRDDTAYMERLHSLFDGITRLYDNTGLQVDLNGPNNIFLTGDDSHPHLELVDTLMVTPEMQALPDRNTGLPTGETISGKMSLISSVVKLNPIVQT